MSAKKETTKKGETAYARRQRRRAEKIISASGCYSAAFRAEVQHALDATPFKLPMLFQEAEEMDRRLSLAGKQIRSAMRGTGLPIGEPASRSPKKPGVRLAEEVETLLIADRDDVLDDEWAGRANLVSDILFEAGNETGVHTTHPQLVKAYVLALLDVLPSMESQRDHDYVQRSFGHVRELMGGCSPQRAEQIANFYSLDREVSDKARAEERGEVYVSPVDVPEPVESEDLAARRAELAGLERLPENEAVALQLETEIFNLERAAATEEWPDVIGGEL